MNIIIHNVVRSPDTRELRRMYPGMVQPSPLIGGQRLPPRRSRNIDTSILVAADFSVLADMTKCGVLKVFTSYPYKQLSEDELRKLAGPGSTPIPVPAPVPKPAVVAPVDEPELVVEEPLAEDHITPEPTVESEPTVDTDILRSELKKKKNAELRDQLSKLGVNSSGMSKATMIDSLVEMMS